jgi:V8-like Glu-specific endopeptidase
MSDERPFREDELADAVFEIERHATPPPEPVTATYEVLSEGGSEPRVEVEQVAGGRWQVRVTVEEGERRLIRPKAIEPVVIPRDELAAEPAEAVHPSLPDGVELTVEPELLKEVERFRIRFGDLRYAPTTIFNPDGRQPYYDEGFPWRCLVRLTTPRGWSGSGVLIGPRHVLTASHCIDWTPGSATVDVLYTNSSSLAQAHGIWAYAETKVGPGEISDEDSDEDYAVIVLDQRLGERFGWLGARTYDSDWDDEQLPWQSIGYPQDWSSTGQTAGYQRDFLLNELGADLGSARLIRSDTFDNWPGQSGSPIFGFWSGGPYVVGVVSGENEDFNYISGGSLLPSIVRRALDDFP